ncbi:MAG: hypothetical protein ACE5GS_07700 [Kiloniellaceae bacterium]
MAEEPKGPGLAWLLFAKAVCCGGLVVAASGAVSLGGLAGWLLDGGIAWLALAAPAVAVFYLWRRHRSGRLPIERREHRTGTRGAA